MAVLSLGLFHPALAASAKSEQSAAFWQRDPKANFDNEGRNHCAPVSVANGLIYLARARGLKGLVDGTDHESQVALITDLAAEMDTDPREGTNPDKILTGLISYAQKRGYSFERLELASWRGVSARNKKFVVGTKPGLAWMTAAAKDPDVVQIFNFGWYVKAKDGKINRRSGHWVYVVGAGPYSLRFDVHNPMLRPKRQRSETGITLKPVDKSFRVSRTGFADYGMLGYYKAEGEGLPFSKQSVAAAVLDGVIVFKLKKD